jgi:hypothetical protein
MLTLALMRLKLGILFTSISLYFLACSTDAVQQNVGDISFNPKLDRADFKACNEKKVYQYYVRYSSDKAPGYQGEKPALEKLFEDNYSYPKTAGQSGYITIRFLVNCHGETGRFRVEEMDRDYKAFQFDSKISEKLLEITKSLDGWIPRKKEEQNLDYYQYLTFKIRDGQLIQILP